MNYVAWFSSPQRGSFLSTKGQLAYKKNYTIVFVPSTGFFSIYQNISTYREHEKKRFRPLNGVLFYLHV